MSGIVHSEEALRGLKRDKVVEIIAQREAELEVQQALVSRLDSLLDDEQRQLWDMERGLDYHRGVLSQIDALPPLPGADQ